MKALIWIGCFFVMSVIQVKFRQSGINLGAIPIALLFGATWYIAKTLSKKWDDRKTETKENNNTADTEEKASDEMINLEDSKHATLDSHDERRIL